MRSVVQRSSTLTRLLAAMVLASCEKTSNAPASSPAPGRSAADAGEVHLEAISRPDPCAPPLQTDAGSDASAETGGPSEHLGDSVRDAVTARMPAIEACYEAANARLHDGGGPLSISLRVGADGALACFAVVRAPFDDPPFDACITDAFRDLNLMLPPGMTMMHATWNFRLTPS